MKNTFLKTILCLAILVFVIACNEDDYTGESTLTPVNTSLTVTLDFSNTQSLVERDSTYNFTVTLSEPQIVDVNLFLEQTGGTATNGADFEMPSNIIIPAGLTSASGSISIFRDDIIEETENAVITIATGLEANVNTINSQTVTFDILNYTDGNLVIDFSWTSPENLTDNFGNPIADVDLADLVFYVTNPNIPSTLNYITANDGEGFETLLFKENYPDGEFHIVAEFISGVTFDDVTADLDISLTLNQAGTITDKVELIPAALNTGFTDCQSTILAKLTKSGNTYNIEPLGIPNGLGGTLNEGSFIGLYKVETTVYGGFGSQFDSEVYLEEGDNGIRSFFAPWNDAGFYRVYDLQFSKACGTVNFAGDQPTGLYCPDPLTVGPGEEVNYFSSDDSSFTVDFIENPTEGCGFESNQVQILFTKL